MEILWTLAGHSAGMFSKK